MPGQQVARVLQIPSTTRLFHVILLGAHAVELAQKPWQTGLPAKDRENANQAWYSRI